jgi:hypothetical protein
MATVIAGAPALTVINLTKKEVLYNFLSTFNGGGILLLILRMRNRRESLRRVIASIIIAIASAAWKCA